MSSELSIEKIFELENIIKQCEQVNLPLGHFLSGGVYVRSMFIPKDTVLTGKIHAKDCITLVVFGDITLRDENGVSRVKGPFICESKAGMKRAGYAHEDTFFVTIHKTDNTDLNEIEKELTIDVLH